MKNHKPLMLALVMLLAVLLACGKTQILAEENTDIPDTPTPDVATLVEVQVTNTYPDASEYGGDKLHIVGVVKNTSAFALFQVEVTIEVLDASGASILMDYSDKIVPSVDVTVGPPLLKPGETGVFDYRCPKLNGTPVTINVTATDVWSIDTEVSPRMDVQAENVKMTPGGDGYQYISGELVNKSDQWVRVNAVIAATVDASNNILSDEDTVGDGAFMNTYAPAGDAEGRDRGTFMIWVPDPGPNVSGWTLFYDPSEINAPNASLDAEVTNTFFDEYGTFYVNGWVINNGTETLSTSFVEVTLWNTDGTILAADFGIDPGKIPAGKRLPFFTTVGPKTLVTPGSVAALDHISVRVQHDSTYTPPEINYLEASGEQINKEDNQWVFTGNVTNNSGKNLRMLDVIVIVYDREGKLVAAHWAGTFGGIWSPGFLGGISAVPGQGETVQYEIYVTIDPNADTSGYTTETIVEGTVDK
jgi:hypothetical protein